MKAQINKDKLTLAELESQNSGSVNYYEIECEFDESWDGLTKEMVLAKDVEGIHRGVINGKAFIDRKRSGRYDIGFVGYTIENDVKVYQVSTNLVPINLMKGAGEIDVLDDVVPTPTEWEVYIAQIQAMVDEIKDLPSYDITEEDIENWNNKVTDDDYVHTDNNFTDEEKEKLESVEEGAEVNKVDDVEVNGVSVVNNKKARITVPTKTSQIQNDSDFVSDANYVHTDNNFTNIQKNKLAGLENYDDTEVKQDISALNNDVEGLDGSKQNKQDNALATINKLIVSAINEIFASVGGIQALISPQASPTNPVVDKDFVNSTVGTNTAIFRGTYNTLAELEQQTATNNDYGFVISTDSAGNTLYNRYKYNGTAWVFEYALNNSSFTAEQWNAITSSITQALVELISTNQNNIATIMADYIKSTDYARTDKGGTFKIDNGMATQVNVNGLLMGVIKTYEQYLSGATYDNAFICKRTLENIFTGKGLVKSTSISSSSTDDNVVTPKAVYDYIESLDISEVEF